ncbi:Mu transposase C-terminal domain-containing protein [Brevibacillus agri]|uniref:Mu transposase C-terminal domain-containing protein n=1 Tax=Brevibacillus TaxID=55080 RepID=UPI001561C152|nr:MULTISPECIES: Mu transposase C-terminal domain-containing protein [Brevibacillus]MBE5393797.1 DDE-type integrase/transposase/recombinase [Brevibacillus borstelensis]MED1645992.1 Mu transposase C-terminal domain-containing protein [Brevibacillus agri]MED1656305.1 Mu transposase C-terminal domain-containing protein [Brevibacillus agri]MED1689227.1 Mu transposase C-terminal domain-containing protein [Brevibacillus agri]MED1693750.1 Mu transposase C-terminal domain-containing protein [Brevibaci
MLLAVNTLIQIGQEEKKVMRVVWLDESLSNCYAISIYENRYPEFQKVEDILKEIQAKQFHILTTDPLMRPVFEEVLTDREREHREQAWEVIQSIASSKNEPAIFFARTRNRLIHEAANKFGISEKTIRRWLLKYWKGGKTKNALLPLYSNCGGKNKEKRAGSSKRGRPRKYGNKDDGINVTENIQQIFRLALKKYYYTKRKGSLRYAYEQMLKEWFSVDYKIQNGIKIPVVADNASLPTLDQFLYFYRKENTIRKEVSTRHSPKEYELKHRAVLGKATTEAIGPASKFLIDGTSFDIYLISRFNRNWIIGRPHLTYIQDVFSHMIVGVHVGLEASWMSAAMAIAHTVEDKVEYMKRFGIDISPEDWPSKYLCETIMGDRGELFTKKAESIIQSLNITVQNTSSYRGDLKGILERHFRLTTDLVKPLLPGSINEDFRQRGSRDYRLDAKLDLQQFTKLILLCVLHFNKHHYLSNYDRQAMMVEDDVPCVPIALWNWGIKYRSGKLRELPQDIVKLHLLPTDEATVTFQGIRFQKMYYSSSTAIHERWFERARSKGNWKIPISYDPRDMTFLYIRGVGERGYETAFLLDHQQKYKDKTIEEVNYLMAMENIQRTEHNKNAIQSKIDLFAEIESVVREAEKETNLQNIGGSKAEKLRDIRKHRNFEKQVHQKNDAFVLHENQIKGAEISVVEAEQDYFADFSLFQKKQKERGFNE